MITEVHNFLPVNYIRDVRAHVENNLTWKYLPDTSYFDRINLGLWDKQLTAAVIPNVHDNPEQNKYSFFYPIIYMVEEKFSIKIKAVIRLKFNMTFTCPEDTNISAWHSDSQTPGVKSLVIYINDSDGGTVVSNSVDDTDGGKVLTDSERVELNESAKHYLEFEPNKAIMFDSNLFHYGELPKKHKNRIVMNMVFLPEEC